MKKIFQLCGLFILSFIISACQKNVELQKRNWQSGQPQSALNELNSIPVAKEKFQIKYKNSIIKHFEQSYDKETTIAGTQIKKISSAKDSQLFSLVEATYVEQRLITKKNLQKINSAKILILLGQLAAPKTLKTFNLKHSVEISNSLLRPVILATYEVSDGFQWQAKINEKYEVLSVNRLGSRFTSDVMASVYTNGPKLSLLTSIQLKNLEKEPTVSSKNIYVDSESTNKISSISANLKFDPTDERFDQVQVYYYLNYIHEWIKKNLDIEFIDRIDAVVNVGFPEKTNTAFYFQNKIRLGRGDDVTYTSLASDPSIVYHEAFHALVDGLANLPYENEGGSLNEAFADFYTCAALGRPVLAESAYLKGPYKRTVDINRNLNEKNGSLYHDSLIISGLLWEVYSKIEKNKTLNLATETLSKLNYVSNFSDFNTEFLKSAKNSLTTDEFHTVQSVLKKRGFEYE